jgi:cell division protein FtsW (lipid II flippase)
MEPSSSSAKQIQSRLLVVAAIFMFIYSLALTLSPAVWARSWEVSYNWDHWLGFVTWLGLFTLAHYQSLRWLPRRDPYILPIAALLIAWGTLTIWRLFPSFGLRQTLWLLLSFTILILGLRLPKDLNFLRRYKYIWLSGGLLLTTLTIIFGTNPQGYGPRLWLGCCGIYLQPSEPLKLLLIIYLAAYLADRQSYLLAVESRSEERRASISLLPLLAPTFIMTGLAIIILIVQRDLGTASIFLFLYTAITYLATGRKRILIVGGLSLISSGIIGYLLFDVVRIRIDAWLNPWADPSGRSYQIVQSLLAVANGGMLGRGPGLGSPNLVPIPHSDFIFAAIAEEHGLVGSIALTIILGLLAIRGLRITLYAPNAFQRYLAGGLVAFIVAQSILIIGGNLRLLPLTGVTLPFVSYGGSSLLTSTLSLLLLLHISNNTRENQRVVNFNHHPYLHLGAFLLVGLLMVAITNGWWAYYRGPDLLNRTDNPRRSIADRYLRRGSLFDRHNQTITSTVGQMGDYSRQITYPDLSPIIGYTNAVYGQSGLEASLDPYLRGLQGYPWRTIWFHHLLYGQPPPGSDVRLSLELDLQRLADTAMNSYSGAMILMNAETGEILVMSSHPSFDANQLDEIWGKLIADDRAPLLNRVTLGRYPIGELANLLLPEGIEGFSHYQDAQIRLPGIEPPTVEDPSFSPFQVLLTAAPLSNNGVLPAPQLALAVNTPGEGWVLLSPISETLPVIASEEADTRAQNLALDDAQIWQSLAVIPNGPNQYVTWYIGGTSLEWQGTPLVIALVLENDDLDAAESIGQSVLFSAMSP